MRQVWPDGMRIALLAAATLAGGSLPLPVLAGAWTQGEGKGEIIFSNASAVANRAYDGRGRPVPSSSFRKTETTLSVAYGWTADTTLLASAGGTMRQIAAGLEGVGAGTLGLRQSLWRNAGAVISAEGIIGVTGEKRLLSGAPWDPPTYAEAALLAGQSLEIAGRGAFIDGRAAFRLASAGRRHQMRLDASFGIRPREGWLVLAQAFGVQETGGGRKFPARRWVTAQASLVYEGFAPWSLQIGVNARVLGRHVAKDSGAVVALWRKF
jgi:protein XagA